MGGFGPSPTPTKMEDDMLRTIYPASIGLMLLFAAVAGWVGVSAYGNLLHHFICSDPSIMYDVRVGMCDDNIQGINKGMIR